MQASEGLDFRYRTSSVLFEHSSSAYQEKVLTTVYWVIMYSLHNILLAISPVGADAFCKNNENSSSQTGKKEELRSAALGCHCKGRGIVSYPCYRWKGNRDLPRTSTPRQKDKSEIAVSKLKPASRTKNS